MFTRIKHPSMQTGYIFPLSGTQEWLSDIFWPVTINRSSSVSSEQKLQEPADGYHVLCLYAVNNCQSSSLRVHHS